MNSLINNNNNNIHNINNNNNNVNNKKRTYEVEYRVTVKRKQTRACDFCKLRKRKCSGSFPCSYCIEKNIACNFSVQKKRGKKVPEKRTTEPEISSTLTKIHTLHCESERYATVDTFCNMRVWWKSLLNLQELKQLSSPAFIAQSHILNAWMARVSRDYNRAQYYFEMAQKMNNLEELENMNSVATATVYVLLADYNPQQSDSYYLRAWNLLKNVKAFSAQERNVYVHTLLHHATVGDYSFSEKHSKLIHFGSAALQSSAANLWDTTNLMLIKLIMDLAVHFSPYKELATSHLAFYLALGKFTIPKDINAALMLQLCSTELLVQSQSHLFGFEFTMCLHSIKVILLWTQGDKAKAITEAIRYCTEMERHRNEIVFLLGEAYTLLMPLMFLNEVGITQYNISCISVVRNICEVDPTVHANLIPVFNYLQLRASPSSLSISSSTSSSLLTLSFPHNISQSSQLTEIPNYQVITEMIPSSTDLSPSLSSSSFPSSPSHSPPSHSSPLSYSSLSSSPSLPSPTIYPLSPSPLPYLDWDNLPLSPEPFFGNLPSPLL